LDDEGVILVRDGRGELCGNGVVGGLVLQYETLVTVEAAEDRGLLDIPRANVRPLFLRVLLLGVGSLPPAVPIVCELLEEGSLQGGGLGRILACAWW